MGGGRGLQAAAAAGSIMAAVDDNGGTLKSSRPEVVGEHVVEAGAIIMSERQDVTLKLLGAGDSQPPDFDAHRVCLFLDDNLFVVRTPVVG